MKTPSWNMKSIVLASFFSLSAIVWLSFAWYDRYHLTTDDAYVNANIVQMNTRISGKIIALYVENNQVVKKDQPLFLIDPEPYQLAEQIAKADYELSLAQLEQTAINMHRIKPLVKKNILAQQEQDNASIDEKVAKAKVDAAKAALDQATLNLKYTLVTSPVAGTIANLSKQIGDMANPSMPLFAIISNERYWIDANFKETEIAKLKPGQIVYIKTDLYPKHPFHGKIDSISRGTGNVFSLLPPQNATGNWVKITQRVPVKINILNPDDRHPLSVGTSAYVNVTIR